MSDLRQPPEGFTNLPDFVDGLKIEMGYHTSANFTGSALPGYGAHGSWLLIPAAESVRRIGSRARDRGLTLLVYDAYRPVRATTAMIEWAEATGNTWLLDQGYVSRNSRHNRGTTIDLTLVRDGVPLDMFTPWDTFDARSHEGAATGIATDNRRLLRGLMEEEGWRGYSKEWWHFSYPIDDNRAPPRDVPYGLGESDEPSQFAPIPL